MAQTRSSNLLEQARQGSPRAIAQLINRALEPKSITVKVSRDSNRLTIIAEANDTPNQESLVGVIRRGIKDLDMDLIDTVKLYGRRVGHPSTDWSDEILINEALTSQSGLGIAKAGQTQTFANLLAQVQSIANSWIRSIRKIRISRRTAYGLGGFALLALMSFIGVVGFQTWQTYSNRTQTISKAETFYKEASDTTKAASVADLTNAIEKLKQAGLLLQGIPSSAGSSYQTAQADLEKVRSQIGVLEQRIKTEEAAATTLNEANRSAQESINTFKNSVKLAEWKTASNSLQKAISQLETIPQDAFVAAQVKANLANYRNQSAAMTKAIGAENKAAQLLDSVDAVAQQAVDSLAGKSDYTLSDLQTAQATWQRAMKLLKTVPAKSVAAAGIESRRSVYMENSNKIAAAIKELQQCQRTSSIKEMCGYISLTLSSPPTNRPDTTSSTTSTPESDPTSDLHPSEPSPF